ncbi:centrosome and spindle pole-associated protein 1 isoform X2 [Betta splendens]|uniref:Centrosome and spindle pole-associated protein 1 isoform X2 n=1 Tax=Betta splendens TaxID=158456 RepID=A0A6P7MDD5_BETSP|nr:centrosome and spindle pole-associated protein 1 isoform X2 [Betta splendens]
MPPTSEALITNSDKGLGLSFLLGADYERKKQKLQQELKLDYKQYVVKEMDRKSSETHPHPQGLSLPIHDNLSVKEKLREERNKEYNVFLKNKAQIRRTGQVPALDASPSILKSRTNPTPIHREQPQRRDAATLTEEGEHGKSRRDPGHQGRRHWQPHSPKEPYSSEDEPMKDQEFKREWRKDRIPAELESNEEQRSRESKTNSLQMPDMRPTARSRPASSKEKVEFATGLLIGTKDDPIVSQMRKEIYKRELLKQIAEQQKNKLKEKKLELRVAATGSTDPEKKPDRILQFEPVNWQQDSWRPSGADQTAGGKDPHQRPNDNKLSRHTEQGGPQGRSEVDSSTALTQLIGKAAPQGASSLDYFPEGYHRDFSHMLGELAIPRVASVPPPVPPAISNYYKTPYDAAYYYYGTRHPLDPHLPHYQNGPPRRESGNFHSLPQSPRMHRPSGITETTHEHRAFSLGVGKVLPDKSKPRIESVLSYQESLREQIKEREESKRREKEEKEQYEAKIEAEMAAYNPWGKSGGGAPIKDQKGNLFSDLKQMHKINEESYKNPSVMSSEVRTPRPRRLSVSDQPTPQHQDTQERYKQALKQQIDDNKRKRAKEKEQMRMEEEKEEKRLLEQRTRMQWEYEEEQRRQKNMEKQSRSREPKSPHQEEQTQTKQEQDIAESIRQIEDKVAEFPYKKEPSPPIPAWQNKQTNTVVPRPPSVASQLSTKTEASESAPPAVEKIAPLRDGQQQVMRELSALRQYLWTEKRQLEAQLGREDGQEAPRTPPNRRRGRPRAEASAPLHKQIDQPSAGRLYSGAARVNMENIREFNMLKHRDTESREDVRHMYPDPPTDAQSLDIQQQVLLREQRRKIRRMKGEEERDRLELNSSHYYDRNKHGRFIHTDAALPSETTFIDVYSSREQLQEQKPRRPSAEPQERTTWRTHVHDEAVIATNQRAPKTQSDTQLLTSQNGETRVRSKQQRIRRRDSYTIEQNGILEGLPADETDTASLRSALESPVSVETVATEPWLRPGTSDDVKRSGSRPRPNRGTGAPPWLTRGIT